MKKAYGLCLDYFHELFGAEPRCELVYKTDIDLLVAIILSAQCTDKRVNKVTAELFKKYKMVSDYANADPMELQSQIHSCGFYRTKAANIIKMAKAVMTEHGGKIPAYLDKLVKLAGVGRKTANVFLSEYCKLPAIAVDTHVARVSRRLGFSRGKNPDAIEYDLMKLFQKEDWSRLHRYLVLFGRYHCKSQRPQCNDCKLSAFCDKI